MGKKKKKKKKKGHRFNVTIYSIQFNILKVYYINTFLINCNKTSSFMFYITHHKGKYLNFFLKLTL